MSELFVSISGVLELIILLLWRVSHQPLLANSSDSRRRSMVAVGKRTLQVLAMLSQLRNRVFGLIELIVGVLELLVDFLELIVGRLEVFPKRIPLFHDFSHLGGQQVTHFAVSLDEFHKAEHIGVAWGPRCGPCRAYRGRSF